MQQLPQQAGTVRTPPPPLFLTPHPRPPTPPRKTVTELFEESLEHRASLCDSGLPDPDMCLISETEVEPPPHLPVRFHRFDTPKQQRHL